MSAALVASATRRAAALSRPTFMRGEAIRVGDRLALSDLVAAYHTARSGDVVQYELGFGAAYDKQVGFGQETDGSNQLYFVETQVGNGDHACNPNTLKKVYLKSREFAGVFTPYRADTYVTRSGNMLTRWGDGVGPRAADLMLLDARTLYDPRRATVSAVRPARVTVDGRTIATTHVGARYEPAGQARLRTVDLWLSDTVPLGLVKMTATAPDVDPFTLSVYTYARHFKTKLAMSRATVRALTPTGDVSVIQ